MNCPNCGHFNGQGVSFCANCGTGQYLARRNPGCLEIGFGIALIVFFAPIGLCAAILVGLSVATPNDQIMEVAPFIGIFAVSAVAIYGAIRLMIRK